VEIQLNAVEARVLGALIEKDITTPDYYPLSLNALVNACNQKNNRDPVMTLDDNVVRDALDALQEKRLAGPAGGADSRVTKYEHRMQEAFNFDRKQIAILCVLLLRGPQTPGELRGRTERMYSFQALDDVQSTLQRLIEGGFAAPLARQPGSKETRYSHLFSAAPVNFESPVHLEGVSTHPDRLEQMEREIDELRKEVADLKNQFAGFRRQLE
jgi:uncharacterized protein YceH (UPF0502 family)